MKRISKWLAVSALAATATGCAAGEPVFTGLPPVQVTASGETAPVGTGRADAADDPAIWIDPANPNRALIVATDKKAGLHVYDLTGKDIAFMQAGLVNNVDVAGNIIVASDRNDGVNAHLAVFRLDADKPAIVSLGRAAAGTGEAYGLCLKKTAPGAPITAALIIKDGMVRVGTLTIDGTPSFATEWEYKIPTQSEGCVFDGDTLYVGEEDAGVWELKPNGKTATGSSQGLRHRQRAADCRPVRRCVRSRWCHWASIPRCRRLLRRHTACRRRRRSLRTGSESYIPTER